MKTASSNSLSFCWTKGNRKRRSPRCKPSCSARPRRRLWELLGDAYNQIHDLPNAEQAYRKAADAQPDDINHRKELAQTLLTEEKYPEALEQYQRLAQMDADDPDNYLRLAEIYRQLKQLDKAEQNVLLAKQRAPSSLEVTYYEASIYEDEGRFDDSIRVLSDAVTAVKAESEFTPSRRRTLAILYQQLGQLYRETSNYTAAVNTFEEMLRLGTEEDRRARVLIIDTYRDARDIPKALDAARKAVGRLPEGPFHPDHTGASVRRKRADRSGRFAASRPARRFGRRFRNPARYRAGLRTRASAGPTPNRPSTPRKKSSRTPPARK